MNYAGDYDVIVAGGRIAGALAATAAARNGAHTLLVEKNGSLGDVPTAAMISCFLSFHNMRGEQAAAGVAAALCAHAGVPPKDIDIQTLRRTLLTQGVIL